MTSKDRYGRSPRLLAQLAQFKADFKNGQEFKLEAESLGKLETEVIDEHGLWSGCEGPVLGP